MNAMTYSGQTAKLTSDFGGRFDNYNVAPQWVSLNRRGDLLARLLEYQNVLYPAAEAPWIVPGLSSYGKPYLNDAGVIAATERISPNGIEAVVLWRDQQGSRIAGTGDQLPDGSFLLSGGLATSCLADDGTVAVAAQADTGEAGLLCVDAAGTHVVTRVGDPTPAGRRFYEFAQCNISPADEIIFAAGRLVPGPPEALIPYAIYRVEYGIYRADHDRLERLVGPGDLTIDGEVVGRVGSLIGASQSQFFDNDASGRVLAFVYLEGAYNAYTAAMVLRDTDGSLRRLPIAMNTGIYGGGGIGFTSWSDTDHLYLSGESPVPTLDRRPSYERSFAESGSGAALAAMPARDEDRRLKVIAARLADSGDVILLTVAQVRRWWDSSYEDGPAVLVRLSDSGLQQLFEGEEWVWDLRYRYNLHSLQVVGDRIVFNDGHRENGIFVYDLGEGQAVEVARVGNPSPAGTLYGIQIVGLTADGTVYVSTWSDGRTALLSSQNGALQLVAEGDSSVPSAVSSGGTLLLSGREILQTQGDAPTAASCPMPPTVVLPTATVRSTPTMTPTRTPTRTPRSATPAPTAAASTPSASPPIPMSPSPTITPAPEVDSPASAGCTLVEPRRAGYSWLLLFGAILLMELRFAVRLQSASRQRIGETPDAIRPIRQLKWAGEARNRRQIRDEVF